MVQCLAGERSRIAALNDLISGQPAKSRSVDGKSTSVSFGAVVAENNRHYWDFGETGRCR